MYVYKYMYANTHMCIHTRIQAVTIYCNKDSYSEVYAYHFTNTITVLTIVAL